MATLERLEKLHPHFALLYQERGYCFVFLGEAARAIEAFQTAVSLNPLLLAGWGMLERLSRATGNGPGAELAAARRAALSRLPPPAMQLVNTLAHQHDAPDEAERLLEEILALVPEFLPARLDYVRVLIDRQQYSRARGVLDSLPPDSAESNTADTLALCAAVCVGLGEYEQAISVYRRLLTATPDRLEMHLPLAHCLKAIGRQKEAIEAYQIATGTTRGYADACWSLANLKTYEFSELQLAGMRDTEAAPATRPGDRYSALFSRSGRHF